MSRTFFCESSLLSSLFSVIFIEKRIPNFWCVEVLILLYSYIILEKVCFMRIILILPLELKVYSVFQRFTSGIFSGKLIRILCFASPSSRIASKDKKLEEIPFTTGKAIML